MEQVLPCVPDSQARREVAGPASPRPGAGADCRGGTGHRSASSAAAGAVGGQQKDLHESLVGARQHHLGF